MRLYTKFMVWAVLNLVLVGVVVLGGSWLLLGSNGLFVHVLFRGGINSVMQIVVANLQYKPVSEWSKILDRYSQSYGIRFLVQALDGNERLPSCCEIPAQVIEAAKRIPRPQVSLCPEPSEPGELPMDPSLETGSGFLPMQNAVYLRHGSPTRYWYGRPVFVPDEGHQLHYVLLVSSSSSFSGNGLYFNFYGALATILLVLGLSFVWWLPFVLHITRPIRAVTGTAVRIAAGDYVLTETGKSASAFMGARKDEIRRLADAVDSMSSQLMRQMYGQRRFIRHIAHELGSPIARVKYGLAVLESRLEGEYGARIRTIGKDVEQVSLLMEDVLCYLRSEGLPGQPHPENFPLAGVLQEVIELEGQNAEVELRLPEAEVSVLTDQECLRRAVSNALRNAVRYAGEAGPILVRVEVEGHEAVVRVEDNGEGVRPEELPHLTEPFFRGAGAGKHPGGSGLGLSIVKHCMDICGGRIEFANRTPKGFGVSLYFPLRRKVGAEGQERCAS
jgi:two-component system sensor histidine kinase CpxA